MTKAVKQPQEKRQLIQRAILNKLNGRSLIFVGMMGSGKTAIGKMVASELEMEFCDSDKEIVDAADLEIPEIFEKFGEPYFRAGEERVIQRLLDEGSKIISLGGGAFMSETTREACYRKGISVWLKGDADLLMSRVMRRPGSRPMLNTDNPKQTLIDLMEKREPIYALAEVHVDSSKHSKARTRDRVLSKVKKYLENTNS